RRGLVREDAIVDLKLRDLRELERQTAGLDQGAIHGDCAACPCGDAHVVLRETRVDNAHVAVGCEDTIFRSSDVTPEQAESSSRALDSIRRRFQTHVIE